MLLRQVFDTSLLVMRASPGRCREEYRLCPLARLESIPDVLPQTVISNTAMIHYPMSKSVFSARRLFRTDEVTIRGDERHYGYRFSMFSRLPLLHRPDDHVAAKQYDGSTTPLQHARGKCGLCAVFLVA